MPTTSHENEPSAMSEQPMMAPALAVAKPAAKSSVISDLINPFTPRPGHRLVWKDVSMKINANNYYKKGTAGEKKALQVLQGVSGTAEPKQLLCILGHSGSGTLAVVVVVVENDRKKRSRCTTLLTLLVVFIFWCCLSLVCVVVKEKRRSSTFWPESLVPLAK